MGRLITIAAVITLAINLGSAVDAQRRVPGTRPDTTVPVTVALKVGSQAYDFTGRATCTHAPVAGIYDLRAEQWSVQQSSDSGSLSLTHWHPASGADMFNLSVTSGNTRAGVSTVKVGTNGTIDGAGTVTLKREGKGGTFTVAAATAKGAKITGTITCEAFTPAIAEGGD
jgi:hypothetical protein